LVGGGGGAGGGHTRLRERGWGSPNSDEGTYTVVLYIYKYFVLPAFWLTLGQELETKTMHLFLSLKQAQYLNLNTFDKRDLLKLILLWLSGVRNAAVSISCVKENGNIW
jgi:hypothetical protein